jgi:hypothetical protein
MQSKERFELEKEQILCNLEEKINESILSGDISNLSTVSTFSKDLVDACANVSAEMLDLHLTPYDLKSVHEYQISNDKKLSKILKIVEKVLSKNAELKITMSGLSEKLNNLQSTLRNNAGSILQVPPKLYIYIHIYNYLSNNTVGGC